LLDGRQPLFFFPLEVALVAAHAVKRPRSGGVCSRKRMTFDAR